MQNSTHTTSTAMAHDHPDAPKQYGIRIRQETMELISEIQEVHRKTGKPHTLAAIVESAVDSYYETLVEEGKLKG